MVNEKCKTKQNKEYYNENMQHKRILNKSK